MPATEYAADGAHSLEGYRSLARHTGLPVEVIGRLALSGETRGLFDAQTGRLLPAAEIRSRFNGTDGSPSAKAAAALALNEMMRKHPLVDPRAELLRLKAKRQEWTFS